MATLAPLTPTPRARAPKMWRGFLLLALGVFAADAASANATTTASVSASPSRSAYNSSTSRASPTSRASRSLAVSPSALPTETNMTGISRMETPTSLPSPSSLPSLTASPSVSMSMGPPTASPTGPSFFVRATLNISLAGFTPAVGAALRCDAAAALGALLGGAAPPARVTVALDSAGLGAPPLAGADAAGNAASACPAVCTPGAAGFAVAPNATVGASEKCLASDPAPECCVKNGGLCFAANTSACGAWSAGIGALPPLLDATCELGGNTSRAPGSCFAANDATGAKVCALVTARAPPARGVCARAAPAAAAPAPRAVVSVDLIFNLPRNESLAVVNASGAVAAVAAALGAAAAGGAPAAWPALASALSSNCALFVGGCNGSASAAGFPPAVAVAALASYTPPAPAAAAAAPSVDAGLAIGLTVLFVGLAGGGVAAHAARRGHKAAQRAAKPRANTVVDYEALQRADFVKAGAGRAPVPSIVMRAAPHVNKAIDAAGAALRDVFNGALALPAAAAAAAPAGLLPGAARRTTATSLTAPPSVPPPGPPPPPPPPASAAIAANPAHRGVLSAAPPPPR